MAKVHDHYVKCSCGAEYSDTIEACLACGRANPELPTLNAKDPSEPHDEATAPTEPAPTLNGKDE